MRALLAALLLAPLAAAQPEVVDWVEASIAPFESVVRPLQGPVTTPVTTRVSCLLADHESTGQVVVTYRVVASPTWATVVVAPTTDAKSVQSCSDGHLDFETTLTVTASDQAPAFAPAPIVLEVTAGDGERAESAEADVDLSASYFPLLDVDLTSDVNALLAPGGTHEYVLRATNFGNGRTRVETLLVDAGEGLTVGLPAPITLGSKQQGDADVASDLVVRVTAAEQGGFVNRVGTVVVRLTAAYALDDSLGADATQLSFLVTVRSGAGARGTDLPLPALGAIAALALAAALVRPFRP